MARRIHREHGAYGLSLADCGSSGARPTVRARLDIRTYQGTQIAG
jgi:hypothetical protein